MPRFNFGNKGSRDEEVNSNRVSSSREEYQYADEGDYTSANEEYASTLRQLWILIAFCIVGWIVACVGFALSNPIFVLVGVIIVDIPAIRIVLAGGSIAMLFGSIVGATTIIRYSDGTEREDNSAAAGGFAVSIFIWLIALVAGVFSIVIRIFKAFFALMKLKKEEAIETDVKSAPWLPIVVGLAVFAIGLAVSSIVSGINSGDLFADYTESDYTNEEEREIISSTYENIYNYDFKYDIDIGDGDIVKVSYSQAARTYTITVTELGAQYIPLSAGNYQVIVDYDLTHRYISSQQAEALDKYTFASMVDVDTILQDLDNLAIKELSYGYGCYYNVETPNGKDHTFFRIIPRYSGSTSNLKFNYITNPMTLNFEGYTDDISFELYES